MPSYPAPVSCAWMPPRVRAGAAASDPGGPAGLVTAPAPGREATSQPPGIRGGKELAATGRPARVGTSHRFRMNVTELYLGSVMFVIGGAP